MRVDTAPEDGRPRRAGREVDTTASRPTPLALVSDAVAGRDLHDVAASVAHALACPVAVAVPALGAPVIVPAQAAADPAVAAVATLAAEAIAAGRTPEVLPP